MGSVLRIESLWRYYLDHLSISSKQHELSVVVPMAYQFAVSSLLAEYSLGTLFDRPGDLLVRLLYLEGDVFISLVYGVCTWYTLGRFVADPYALCFMYRDVLYPK